MSVRETAENFLCRVANHSKNCSTCQRPSYGVRTQAFLHPYKREEFADSVWEWLRRFPRLAQTSVKLEEPPGQPVKS